VKRTKLRGFEHHSANKFKEYPYVNVGEDAITTIGEGRAAMSATVSQSFTYFNENMLSRPKSNVYKCINFNSENSFNSF
jgi:hypothetical protein